MPNRFHWQTAVSELYMKRARYRVNGDLYAERAVNEVIDTLRTRLIAAHGKTVLEPSADGEINFEAVCTAQARESSSAPDRQPRYRDTNRRGLFTTSGTRGFMYQKNSDLQFRDIEFAAFDKAASSGTPFFGCAVPLNQALRPNGVQACWRTLEKYIVGQAENSTGPSNLSQPVKAGSGETLASSDCVTAFGNLRERLDHYRKSGNRIGYMACWAALERIIGKVKSVHQACFEDCADAGVFNVTEASDQLATLQEKLSAQDVMSTGLNVATRMSNIHALAQRECQELDRQHQEFAALTQAPRHSGSASVADPAELGLWLGTQAMQAEAKWRATTLPNVTTNTNRGLLEAQYFKTLQSANAQGRDPWTASREYLRNKIAIDKRPLQAVLLEPAHNRLLQAMINPALGKAPTESSEPPGRPAGAPSPSNRTHGSMHSPSDTTTSDTTTAGEPGINVHNSATGLQPSCPSAPAGTSSPTLPPSAPESVTDAPRPRSDSAATGLQSANPSRVGSNPGDAIPPMPHRFVWISAYRTLQAKLQQCVAPQDGYERAAHQAAIDEIDGELRLARRILDPRYLATTRASPRPESDYLALQRLRDQSGSSGYHFWQRAAGQTLAAIDRLTQRKGAELDARAREFASVSPQTAVSAVQLPVDEWLMEQAQTASLHAEWASAAGGSGAAAATLERDYFWQVCRASNSGRDPWAASRQFMQNLRDTGRSEQADHLQAAHISVIQAMLLTGPRW